MRVGVNSAPARWAGFPAVRAGYVTSDGLARIASAMRPAKAALEIAPAAKSPLSSAPHPTQRSKSTDWVRNAPKLFIHLRNPLKSQQMRPPSETSRHDHRLLARSRPRTIRSLHAKLPLGPTSSFESHHGFGSVVPSQSSFNILLPPWSFRRWLAERIVKLVCFRKEFSRPQIVSKLDWVENRIERSKLLSRPI